MATLPLTNTFEGGVDGVTITPSNSGGVSGDGFEAVFGSPKFSAAHPAYGSLLGLEIPDATESTGVNWRWFGSLTGNVWARFYLWIPSVPTTSSLTPLTMRDTTGFIRGMFRVYTNGLPFVDSNVTTAFGSIAFPIAALARVELRAIANAGAGEVEARWWSDPDSTGDPDDVILLTGQNNGDNIDATNFGSQNGFPTTPYTIYIDDLAASRDDWIGPGLLPVLSRPSRPTIVGS